MFRILALILILGVFSSCSLIEPLGQDIFTLNKDFELRIFERIEFNAPRQIELIISTTEMQDCENAAIALRSETGPRSLLLRLEDIVEPEESQCIKNPSIISNQIPLHGFSGSLDFIVQLKDVIEHRGTISSDPFRVGFELPGTEGFKIQYNELLRMPDSLVWGSVSVPTAASLGKMQAFIEVLETRCAPIILANGYYSYFTVGPDGRVSYLEGNSDLFRYDFALKSKEEVQDLFQELSAIADPVLNIEMHASNGLRY